MKHPIDENPAREVEPEELHADCGGVKVSDEPGYCAYCGGDYTQPPTVADHIDALEPRVCACGASTGSVALDTCSDCERAQGAVRALHGEATRRGVRG